MQPSRPPAEVIADRLSRFLGPHTARVAVKSFADRTLGRGPETVTLADVPRLLDALHPMLKTMMGARKADALVQELREGISG